MAPLRRDDRRAAGAADPRAAAPRETRSTAAVRCRTTDGPAASLHASVEQLSDQRGDRTSLGPRERDVAEERMSPQRVDHRRDAIVAPDAQVVALRHVVGEYDAASFA